MTVSLEVIPRDLENLEKTLNAAFAYPEIGLINIPDMLRFSVRSWEGCGFIIDKMVKNPERFKMIPHIRAIDFDMNKPFPHVEFFKNKGIKEALIISGDPSEENTGYNIRETDTPAFIKKMKREIPDIKIYAAFDPYRSNIRYELDYLKKKEEAGADGFFSQPFFDLRLIEIYAEYLEDKNVFWGISPVVSNASRNYWESRNRAIFPRSFKPDLQWNIDFGRRVLDFCRNMRFNLYIMPIRLDMDTYLAELFPR